MASNVPSFSISNSRPSRTTCAFAAQFRTDAMNPPPEIWMLLVTMASQLLGCSTAARATELGRMMACAPCAVIRSVNLAVFISPSVPPSATRRYGCLDIMRFFMGSPENISTCPPLSRISSSDWIRPPPRASSTTMMAASFAVYSDTKRIVKRPYTDVSNLPLFVLGSEWWSPPLNRSNDSHSSYVSPLRNRQVGLRPNSKSDHHGLSMKSIITAYELMHAANVIHTTGAKGRRRRSRSSPESGSYRRVTRTLDASV
mmetsp:Transcript_3469/g.13982  ORF Transcript_3469/g.13982 Transcript_3469/m.13982 type:complete len:257 (-) Transcript_3469:553-1323(-)